MELLYEFLFFAIFLFVYAFFSAVEVSFLSLSNVRLNSLVEKNVKNAPLLQKLKEKRRQFIISIIICSTIVNITISAILTAISIKLFGDSGISIAIALLSFLLLTFGEIVPKSFATENGEKLLLFFAPFLYLIYFVSYPLVALFEFINKLIPGVYSRATVVERFSEEELRSAINLSAKHKSISEYEKQLIENVLEFNDRTVGEAMTPKSRVVCLDGSLSVLQAHKKALESSYSRFPVLLNGQVVGVVSIKILDKALYKDPDSPIWKIALEPIRVNVNEKASNAFLRLQKLGRNIAIVVNNSGEFIGVVTLEDLLEELVGELNKIPHQKT
jgi:CBS domain containing-hemolysin-like protein